MENPFKKILEHQEVPKILKQKVLNDVGMIKLTIDVADLFVVKYPNAIGDILNGGKLRNKKKNN
jgi:hypothetical protein